MTPTVRFAVCIVVVVIFTGLSGHAQQSLPKARHSQPVSHPSSTAKAGTELYKLTVLRVQGFSDRILTFQDVKLKAIALARLADLLWDHDESFARQLFLKAIDLPSAKTESSSDRLKLAATDLAYLRQEIIRRIARHDANLAQQLMDADIPLDGPDANATERAWNYTRAAIDLVKDNPQKAIELGERSLRSGVSQGMPWLLAELRRKDEVAANTLFLKTLNKLLTESVVDADNLLALGYYVFTSPTLALIDPPLPVGGVMKVVVGGVDVIDIMADQPGVSPDIVRAYLDTAAKILARPISDPRQRQLCFIYAKQLLPKAEKYAPDHVPQFAEIMRSLIPDIPQALTQESTYKNLELSNQENATADDLLREIEKIPDDRHRNGRYLSISNGFLQRGEFSRARAVAAKIKDVGARAHLLILIDFSEAARSLERGEITFAEEMAGKLPPGIERAILWLGIAHARAKEREIVRASEAINAALATARNLYEARRPFLILAAASELARFDPALAQTTLIEAVREFNSQKSELLAQVRWSQTIEAGATQRHFPIRIKGIEFGFEQALPPLIDADLEGTVTVVSGLKDERQLADALLALAVALLKSAS